MHSAVPASFLAVVLRCLQDCQHLCSELLRGKARCKTSGERSSRGVFSMAFSSVTPTSNGFQAAFLRNPSCKHWRIKKDRKKKKKKKQKGGSAGDCGCFDAHRQQSKKHCAPAEFPFGFHFWAAFADGQHDIQCGSLLALPTSPSLCHLETKKPSACRAGRALQCSPVWQGTAGVSAPLAVPLATVWDLQPSKDGCRRRAHRAECLGRLRAGRAAVEVSVACGPRGNWLLWP